MIDGDLLDGDDGDTDFESCDLRKLKENVEAKQERIADQEHTVDPAIMPPSPRLIPISALENLPINLHPLPISEARVVVGARR